MNRHNAGSALTGLTRSSSAKGLSRRLSRFRILEFLRRVDEATPSHLAQELGVSLPTVVRILADLEEEGFIEGIGREASSIGRPAGLVRFAGDCHAVVAMCAQPQWIYGLVTDLNGRILHEDQVATSENGDDNLEKLLRLIEDLKSRPLPGIKTIRGIGVGVSSMVYQPEGVVVLTMGLGWRSLPLRELLSSQFSVPIFVESDRNLGVIGEWTFGAGNHEPNFVRLSIGPGASAGIVINGELYRGSRYAAGELKWFLDDPRFNGGEFPLLGNRQSLRFEKGIPASAFDALENAALLYEEKRLSLELFDAPISDASLEIVRQLLDYTTLSAVGVSAMLNPSTVVLTGLITRGRSLVVDCLSSRLAGDIYQVPKFTLSSLGYKAVLLGAVKLVMDGTVLKPTA